MITIALCDDSTEELLNTDACLRDYISSRDLGDHMSVTSYASPHELLDELDSGAAFDIYILDILMPGMNGISLGETIRRRQDQAVIIYLSVSPEFFPQAFDLYAFQYQLKPVQPEKLCQIMDRVVSNLGCEADRYFTHSEKSGVFRTPVNNIVYAELSSRSFIIHQTDGSCYHSGYLRHSFEKVMAPLLQCESFLQPHKSFIINMDYVRRMESSSFEMSDGSCIPISKRRATHVRSAYMDHIFSSAGCSCK